MPSKGLDANTLMFATSLLAFLTSGFSYISATVLPRGAEAAREWAKAMFLLGVACLLWFLTPLAPRVFSIVIGNEMSVVAPIFVLRAVYLLANQRFSKAAALGILIVGSSGIFATYFFDVERSAAVLSIASMHLSVALLGSWRISRRRGFLKSPYTAVTLFVLLILGAATTARIWVTLFGAGANAVLPVAASNTQVFAIASGILLIVAGSFGFLGALGEQARQAALHAASLDSLTGLFTRGAFYEKGQELIASDTITFSLLMVDIDHFKIINDRFGHLAGDSVIRHASGLILSTIRSEDLAGRYGGEEFCILMPGCAEDSSKSIAERFVADAEGQSVILPNGQTIAYTLSVGYVTFRVGANRPPATLEHWMEVADRALYEAKRSGRNRAVVAKGGNLSLNCPENLTFA